MLRTFFEKEIDVEFESSREQSIRVCSILRVKEIDFDTLPCTYLGYSTFIGG